MGRRSSVSSVNMVRIVRMAVKFVKNGAGMYWAGTRVTVIMGLSYWAVGTGNSNMADFPTSGIITTVLSRYDCPG